MTCWTTRLHAVASLIYVVFFAVTLAIQVRLCELYRPLAYWAVVVATTTVGTTHVLDYLDRTVGLGYVKSSIALFCGVIVVLGAWRARDRDGSSSRTHRRPGGTRSSTG